jgi:hypothetical protein
VTRMRISSKIFVAVAGILVLAAGPAAYAASSSSSSSTARQVDQMRDATKKFHDIALAEAAGYVPFTDVNGVSCIDMPGMGGMGVHYVNPKLIADPAIDPTAPEALVYAPANDGTLHLAALEYLVDKATWDKTHSSKPSADQTASSAPQLFPNKPFDETNAPNRFGLADFYSQHVWVWKNNPAGLLSMWNPRVNCSFVTAF